MSMIRKVSETANGGITLIIDDLDEANKKGSEFIDKDIKRFEDMKKRGEDCYAYSIKRESTHALDKMKIADFLLNCWEEMDAVDMTGVRRVTAAKKVIEAREKAWEAVKKSGPGEGLHFDPLASVARLRLRYEQAKDIVDSEDESAPKLDECGDGLISKFLNPSGADKAILRKVGMAWVKLKPDERSRLGQQQLIKWLDNYVPRNEAQQEYSKVSPDHFIQQRKRSVGLFQSCVDAISTGGNGDWRDSVSDWVQRIMDMALLLDPSLASGHSGFNITNEGEIAIPERVAMGEEQCLAQRRRGGGEARKTAGDGAYRIIICTDDDGTGQPADEMSGMMGALVVLLQQERPVEIWIQQGWLGGGEGGVTLFSVDFTGGFDPTALYFWCGHYMRDSVYSRFINSGLRPCGVGDHVSTCPEIPCDLYVHKWMENYGIAPAEWRSMGPEDRAGTMAKWVVEQAYKVKEVDPFEKFQQ